MTAAYDEGRFAYVPMQRGRLLTGDFYGEAAIPESYAAHWVDVLQFREMLRNDGTVYLQPMMVFQKPG